MSSSPFVFTSDSETQSGSDSLSFSSQSPLVQSSGLVSRSDMGLSNPNDLENLFSTANSSLGSHFQEPATFFPGSSLVRSLVLELTYLSTWLPGSTILSLPAPATFIRPLCGLVHEGYVPGHRKAEAGERASEGTCPISKVSINFIL